MARVLSLQQGWTDVYDALADTGVNVVGGRVPGPGVGGFTLGGGYSWYVRLNQSYLYPKMQDVANDVKENKPAWLVARHTHCKLNTANSILSRPNV